MVLIAQSLVNAIATGAIFALLGLSFGLIYSTTQLLHFAHGAVYVCAAYLFYAGYVLADWPMLMAALVAIAGAGILGFAVMRLFYQPMIGRGTSGAVIMIASLGLFIVIENLIVLGFGNDARVISKGAVQAGLSFANVYVTPLQLYSLAIALVTFAAVYFLITRSKLGRGLRAIADNTAVAQIVGIDVKSLRYVVFALGSMVLAIAAVLSGLDIGVSPGMGLSVLLIATVAAIIGGANSMFAGIAGGFLVGAVQSLGVLWIDPRWQNLLIFAALIVVLVVRPTGVFGTSQR